MLNYLRFIQDGCDILHRKRLFAALAMTLAGTQTAFAQQNYPLSRNSIPTPPGTQLQMAPPGGVIQVPMTQFHGASQAGTIQQVQNTPQAARAIHRLIDKLPEAQDDLEIIERRSQLVVTKSNVLRMAIGDQSIIDIVQYSPREFSIIGLARGATTLTLWFEGEPDPLIYTIRTIRDPSLNKQRELDYGQLERKIADMYPNSKVYLIPFSWKIVVRGQARDQEEASHILNIIRGEVINQQGGMFAGQATTGGFAGGYGGGGAGDVGVGMGNWGNNFWSSFIINELRVPGEYQIALRVRVAELNRSQLDQAGVNLNILFNNARNIIRTSMGGAGGTLSGVFENGEIGIFLDYLSTNGTAQVLTEPQMTVLSGRTARLLSGGEFAVPTVVGVSGAQSTTTSFRGFGTSLMATPVVVDRDLIRISLIAEYSNLEPANSVGGIPGTDTRRIQTEVELREGQTLALAGLLSNGTATEVSRIPFLGDLPIVGPLLFSTKKSTREQNELLVLITPEIVRPMDANEVPPVPGFEVTKPTHEEFWKYNLTEGPPDTGYYHLPPFGSGAVGTNVDYQHFNPGPAGSMYSPLPTQPNGAMRGPGAGPGAPVSGGQPYIQGQPMQGQPMQGQPYPQGQPYMQGQPLPPSPMPSAQPGQISPMSGPSGGRLTPVPQASRYGNRNSGSGSGYSNQVMMPANSGVRQAGWDASSQNDASRRY